MSVHLYQCIDTNIERIVHTSTVHYSHKCHTKSYILQTLQKGSSIHIIQLHGHIILISLTKLKKLPEMRWWAAIFRPTPRPEHSESFSGRQLLCSQHSPQRERWHSSSQPRRLTLWRWWGNERSTADTSLCSGREGGREGGVMCY